MGCSTSKGVKVQPTSQDDAETTEETTTIAEYPSTVIVRVNSVDEDLLAQEHRDSAVADNPAQADKPTRRFSFVISNDIDGVHPSESVEKLVDLEVTDGKSTLQPERTCAV